MIAPSTKVWNASPTMTSDAALPCVRALAVFVAVTPDHQLLEHEERQDAAEQRAERQRAASSVSSASGTRCSSDAPSSVPTA